MRSRLAARRHGLQQPTLSLWTCFREKLVLDWPDEPHESRASKLDERFLSGANSKPERRKLPFFSDLHQEISRSWKQPFSSRLTNAAAADFTNLVGSVEQGYTAMPVVEDTLASHLSPSLAPSWKSRPLLPSKPCRTTSALIGKSYIAAGQAGIALHTIAIIQSYQEDVLKEMDKGIGRRHSRFSPAVYGPRAGHLSVQYFSLHHPEQGRRGLSFMVEGAAASRPSRHPISGMSSLARHSASSIAFLSRMGASTGGIAEGSPHNSVRLHTSVWEKSPPLWRGSSDSSKQPLQGLCSTTGTFLPPTERSNRGSIAVGHRTRVLQPLLPRSKEGWRPEAHSGSTAFEFFSLQREVQDADNENHHVSGPRRGLVCRYRTKGCVFSHPGRSETQEVPSVCLWREGLPIQGPALRPGLGTENIYEMHGCCTGPFEAPGHSCTELSGQLAHSGSLQGASESSQGYHSLPHPFSWRNAKKSVLLPSQRTVFLGVRLDSFQMQARLAPARIPDFTACLARFKLGHYVSVGTCCRLLGLMAAASPVLPLGLLHMRLFLWWMKELRLHPTVPATRLIRVSHSCCRLLLLWRDPAFLKSGVRMGAIHRRHMITTDASMTGWGAVFEGRPASGEWTEEFFSWHINCLEFRAVFLALMYFLPVLGGYHIIVRTDNMAVMSHINRQGGSRSRTLDRLACRLLLWSQDKFHSLRAVHVPGILNLAADFLSRQKLRPWEWMLNRQMVSQIWDLFGEAEVDLFASQESSQCPLWFSLSFPTTLSIDAFAHPWPNVSLYAFPPIKLIPAVLCRVKVSSARLLLIAPFWPSQTWFSELIPLLYRSPWEIPIRRDLLSQLQGKIWHPQPELWKLWVWPIQGQGLWWMFCLSRFRKP